MNASIGRVRLQLTALYVGVFAIVLAIFGFAVYTVVNRQMLQGLDSSLQRAVYARTRLYLAGEAVKTSLAQDTAIYGMSVYVFNKDGEPLSPDVAADWVREFAQRVLVDSIAKDTIQTTDRGEVLIYGQKFRSTAGNTFASVSVTDFREIRNRYPSLVRGFLVWTIAALFLIGIAGITLASRATRPIEQAFNQMRQFMADAAHELKTPVAVLRARADVALQRPRTPSEYQESLMGVSAEAKRLGSLIENMLLLARADAGQWPITRENVFLDDILLDAAAAARALAAQKRVDVEVGELQEAPVSGDPTLLRQLFMILLDNAINFTPEGGSVTVSSERYGRTCRVLVTDTGIGIPHSQLPHVFDRFYRVDSARSRAGAGLGLSIAQWIVDQHGGDIMLKSIEGAGTTAVVELPAPEPAVAGPVVSAASTEDA